MYLTHELVADEETDLEEHLDTCPECRKRLEQAAAEPHWWANAGDYLKCDDVDSEFECGDANQPGDAASALESGVTDVEIEPQYSVDFLDPSDDPRMLGRFGGDDIVGVIGYGGMGIVLKGFDAPLNRYVAIKVLAPHLATRGAARRRFAREARAAAAVMHENVIAIHRVSGSGKLPFLVMPYVRGASLQKRIDEKGPLEVLEILRVGMHIASGLAEAHAQGIVHRDIKPANVLLEEGVERVTITDFGLARAVDDASLTRTGVIAGTPQYMSPEQARGEMVDHRSDLFSLGSVLYAMCTGRPPFRAETMFGVLRRISDSPPRPIREIAPEIPDWLCAIVDKLHAKEPDQRFQTAWEVAELLARCLAHVQEPVTSPLPSELATKTNARSVRRTSRRRAWIAGIIGLLLAAGVGGIGLWRALDPANRSQVPGVGALRQGTIIWVSDGWDGIEPGTKNDQGFVDLLTDHGYTVVRKDAGHGVSNSLQGPLSDAQKALLNNADLVIVSRCARSDDYNFPDDWNSLTSPLLLLTPYLTRSDRWRWFEFDNWEPPTGIPALEAVADHDLFDDVSLTADGHVNILTAVTAHVDVTTAGNGTVVARTADNRYVWIAHWTAGTEFFPGAGRAAQGERMYFSAGTYHWDPPMTGGFNLNAQGQKLLLNAVDSLIGQDDDSQRPGPMQRGS